VRGLLVAVQPYRRFRDGRPLWIAGLPTPDQWRSLRQATYPQLLHHQPGRDPLLHGSSPRIGQTRPLVAPLFQAPRSCFSATLSAAVGRTFEKSARFSPAGDWGGPERRALAGLIRHRRLGRCPRLPRPTSSKRESAYEPKPASSTIRCQE
jgi:hypothetical protein